MAEIKVQRRSGVPWWLWAAAIVLAIWLAWWLIEGLTDNESVVVTETELGAVQQPLAGDTIRDVQALLTVANPAELIGRPVQLNAVQVQEVVSDRLFYVGPTAASRVPVVLQEVPTPGTAVEGRYDVTAGQTIDVSGFVRAPQDAVFGGEPIVGLPANAPMVVQAMSLNIEGRP